MNKVKLTAKNIKYGMLVEVASLTGKKDNPFDFKHGYHSGMKVHFFNKKGVLIGNIYEFVPYERVRLRPDKYVWPRVYMGKPFETVRQFLFELKCRVITFLINNTQNQINTFTT